MSIEIKTRISRFLRRATEIVWPFGAFQKTNDPHKAIENLERASGAATLWILLGIFVEVIAMFVFPHSFGERAVGLLANLVIGLGLIVEYLVVGRVIDAAGWIIKEPSKTLPSDRGVALLNEYDGIHVRIDATRREEWWSAVEAIMDIFKSEEIDAEAFANPTGTPKDAITIFIGRKM